MPLAKQEIAACTYCMKDANGKSPCVSANRYAQQNHRPVLRVTMAGDVKWPCYFHADWHEVAPLLLGQLPGGDGRYHQSDLALMPYPDTESRTWMKTLKEDTATYVNRTPPHDVEVARSELCARAVRYVTAGEKATYIDGSRALLYASHRGGRYQSWLDALKEYADCKGMLVSFIRSKWELDTYGGGGAFNIALGDMIVKSPTGGPATLAYGAIGPGLSTPKMKKIPASVGRSERAHV